jgi:hypothetical protein
MLLAVAACGVFILLWQFWRFSLPASRRRLSRSDDNAVYVKSNCRLCGGSIEFPEHGLGARVLCPHCDEQIELRPIGATERILLGVRVWCRERSFNWKWAFTLMAVLLVCGTALFIYLGWQSEMGAQAKRRLEQEAQQTAAESEKAYWLQQVERANDPFIKQIEVNARLHEDMEKEERLDNLLLETWKFFSHEHPGYSWDPSDLSKLRESLRSGMTPEAARSQLEEDLKRRRDMEEVKAELRRGNDLAEHAAFQHRMDQLGQMSRDSVLDAQHRTDAEDAAFQHRRDQFDQMSRDSALDAQHRMDAEDAASQHRRDKLAASQSSAWVLKYNPFSRRYQYAPPNAQLKYNALENRWEWVP